MSYTKDNNYVHIEFKEMQSTSEKSNIVLRLKKIDKLENEQELKEYLETLDLTELIEIYYIQSCEINIIRKEILNYIKEDANKL